jgi:hypothetical protein
MFVFTGLLLTLLSSKIVKADDLFDMMDNLDKQTVDSFIDKAINCAKNNDFDCTATNIGKAEKYVAKKKDRSRLEDTKRYIASRKKLFEDEQQRNATERRNREEREERQRAENERREAEYRRTHACDNLYQGKKVSVSKELGSILFISAGTAYYDAIVLGISNGSGQATVRTTHDGKTHEVSCDRMQIY